MFKQARCITRGHVAQRRDFGSCRIDLRQTRQFLFRSAAPAHQATERQHCLYSGISSRTHRNVFPSAQLTGVQHRTLRIPATRPPWATCRWLFDLEMDSPHDSVGDPSHGRGHHQVMTSVLSSTTPTCSKLVSQLEMFEQGKLRASPLSTGSLPADHAISLFIAHITSVRHLPSLLRRFILPGVRVQLP